MYNYRNETSLPLLSSRTIRTRSSTSASTRRRRRGRRRNTIGNAAYDSSRNSSTRASYGERERPAKERGKTTHYKGSTKRQPSLADSKISDVNTQPVIHVHHVTITHFYANSQQIPTITEEFHETGTRPSQIQLQPDVHNLS
eukprot:296661-Amphidinium_carterae.1